MARQTIVQLVDDLTGEVVEQESDFHTVSFAVDGQSYEIDLSTDNLIKFREALAVYVEHARKVGGMKGRRSRPTMTNEQRELARKARDWGLATGRKVSRRGRVAATLLDEYIRAHADGLTSDAATAGRVVPIKASISA